MGDSTSDVPRMNWESGNLVETWRRFKQHVERMFSGPLREKSEAEKFSYLLIWVGEKGRDIFNTWSVRAAGIAKGQSHLRSL